MKKVLIYFILLVSFMLSQHEGHSHNDGPPKIGVIYGEIIDAESSLPVEYTLISVYNSQSEELITGGITDSDGYFSIDRIPLGNYLILIEFIGYEDFLIEDVKLNQTEGIKKKSWNVNTNSKGHRKPRS